MAEAKRTVHESEKAESKLDLRNLTYVMPTDNLWVIAVL